MTLSEGDLLDIEIADIEESIRTKRFEINDKKYDLNRLLEKLAELEKKKANQVLIGKVV